MDMDMDMDTDTHTAAMVTALMVTTAMATLGRMATHPEDMGPLSHAIDSITSAMVTTISSLTTPSTLIHSRCIRYDSPTTGFVSITAFTVPGGSTDHFPLRGLHRKVTWVRGGCFCSSAGMWFELYNGSSAVDQKITSRSV